MNDLHEIEDRLRDATRAYADGAEPAPDAWDQISLRTRAASRRRRAIWIGATAAVAAAAVFAGALMLGDDPTRRVKTPPVATTPKTSDLKHLSHILFADLPGRYGETTIDTSTPGVITIGLFAGNESPLAYESEIASAGTESGLWTAADAARMVRTQARDGVVRSDNGETTWTYPEDGGLQIVAPVP